MMREPIDELEVDLAYAKAGQVHFDRTLFELGENDVREPSLLPGWTRAHVIAHVGFNARALTRLVDWATTDIPRPMYESVDARSHEIDTGAALSDIELRTLSGTEAEALEAAWSRVPPDRWAYRVSNAQGVRIPVIDTVWMRSRELWLHALDLDLSASTADVPAAVQRRITQNVLDTWATRDGYRVHATVPATGERLEPAPSRIREADSTCAHLTVSGSLPNLMAWVTGRRHTGVSEVDTSGRDIGAAPSLGLSCR
ncbi:maleylpyruvate isomerase N-terminal domain-containing protein [Rhodococcus sovatensis]|uniref:Maleylpyruvate isomerase family mycothiol-dependent enzyme n=1 Tax=Rhodococcus sovatensis TaxID=1805840 RepID=A0ABZ2PQ50_9NOCA